MVPTQTRLFTPGPINTSKTVKEAMLVDMGYRDEEFTTILQSVRQKLTTLAAPNSREYTTVLLQGCGTYGVESVFQNVLGKQSNVRKALILANGFFGHRMRLICEHAGYNHNVITNADNTPFTGEQVEAYLKKTALFFDLVAIVHCDTASGIVNPIEEIATVVKSYSSNTLFFVDAMCTFGAYDINIEAIGIDFLVSSANKCIQGVPGFTYVITKKSHLQTICKGNCSSLSFDLHEQWVELEKNGKPRFTFPTHCLLAFHKALQEHEKENGLSGRRQRYANNYETLRKGMDSLGFKGLLNNECQGVICSNFLYPDDPNFVFEVFCKKLRERGCIIYVESIIPSFNCFRVGIIGELYAADCEMFVNTVADVLKDMCVQIPVCYKGYE